MESKNKSKNVIVRIHPAGAILPQSWPAGLGANKINLFEIYEAKEMQVFASLKKIKTEVGN